MWQGRKIRDLRCYVTVLQDNRERKEMAENPCEGKMQMERCGGVRLKIAAPENLGHFAPPP